MKSPVVIVFIVSFLVFTGFHFNEVSAEDYYRTFEIIGLDANSLTLKDNDGNVIEVEKAAPEDYKIGYKVRYDSVRNRLKPYRWQEYKVTAVSDDSITLEHKSGDTLNLPGNYSNEYKVGDSVRYDSIGDKLQPYDETSQWQQYTVIAESRNQIVLRNNQGEEIMLKVNNNKYAEPVPMGDGLSLRLNNNEFTDQRGLYIPMYEVGDKVRYNAKNNKLKKETHRTYDWQDYEIKEITEEKLFLVNEKGKEVTLKNTYGNEYRAGDKVKYDRLNNILKKAR
jgi:hypothetical protein